MRKSMIIMASSALLALGACSGITGNRTVDSGIVGAGAGAAAGSVIDGVSTGEGALIGGAAGAVYGAVTNDKDRNSHRYCSARHPRDSRGYDRCRRGR